MQLWVNLPKKDKSAPPAYQPIRGADIPSVTLADGSSSVRVIAGEYSGARGPARTFTPIMMLDAHLKAGSRLAVPLSPSYNALAVVANGRMSAGGKEAHVGELVLFANDGAELQITAETDAHVVLLAGEPIGEPIVQHGPFVMNDVEGIEQAIADVQRGKFGPVPA
jgi:redox-sensitive bicupin YhaK (pirin superfamily)